MSHYYTPPKMSENPSNEKLQKYNTGIKWVFISGSYSFWSQYQNDNKQIYRETKSKIAQKLSAMSLRRKAALACALQASLQLTEMYYKKKLYCFLLSSKQILFKAIYRENRIRPLVGSKFTVKILAC